MAYEKLNLKTGDELNEAVFKKIDDNFETVDAALGATWVDVEKNHYSTNRFDKSITPISKGFYVGSDLHSTRIFQTIRGTNNGFEAGSGWRDIPIESGKTYTMAINPLTLSDYNNIQYGVFVNLWFTDAAKKVVATVPFDCQWDTGASNYYGTIGGIQTEEVKEVAYSSKKVTCKGYPSGGGYMGMRTSKVQFTVIDPNIAYINVQIGAETFGKYQLNRDFISTRGHLTDAEVEQLENSFQINEGDTLLEYEVGGDYVYTEPEIRSNLTKIQSLVSEKIIPSTNLLDPAYAVNHKYISTTTFAFYTYARSAMLKIPIKSTGKYILYSNSVMPIGNKEFGYFGKCVFTDADNKYVCGNYGFSPDSGIVVGCDPSKVTVSGEGTTELTFQILTDQIKFMHVPLLDSDKNASGLWTKYEPTEGLTDEELYSLVNQMQLNKDELVPWQPFDYFETEYYVTPESIEGLSAFQSEMENKINQSLATALTKESNMACEIRDNLIFVKARKYTDTHDFMWRLHKIGGGENKYFNIHSCCLTKATLEPEDMTIASVWKDCADDICPPSIQGSYIAANHGYNCVDKITATSHGKAEVDIGSVWTDSTGKTYVLTHIYDENTLGFVMFNDTNMANGLMGYGNPTAGTSLNHKSGATNTSSVNIEKRVPTQLWKCYNHYSIKLLIDGVEHDLDTNATFIGNKVEIMTQYDVIYIPAMLNYLMENVGNNTVDSQHSDDIADSYMTMYINYQFNLNGSLSTYSSFYINKNISVGYIGLVQSIALSTNPSPYTYVPDTTYKVLTLHDGSATQHFQKDTWDSTEKAPYRYYQFTDTIGSKGMALVYDRTIGWGENAERLKHLSQAGNYFDTRKMYPAFIAGGSLSAGTYFDGLAARVPLYKYDPDLTSIGWYWCSDDIILMIDTHNSVNKDIVLPDYMNNMRIEVLDKTDSCNVSQTYIFNNKLRFQCADYGYAVLRLYK